MLKKASEWLAKYSKSLVALAALLTILVTVVSLVGKPLWSWFSGPTLAVTIQRNESTMPEDLAQWQSGLGFALPDIAAGLQRQAAQLRERKPNREDCLSDLLLRDVSANEDNWGATLQKYANGLTRAQFTDLISGLSSMKVILQNPSSSELKHVRISVSRLYGFWGLTAAGTFLTQEEIESIKAKVKAIDNQVVLPEIATLPAGAKITLTLYGRETSIANVTAAVEGADVTMTEFLVLQDSWFLQLYRSGAMRGAVYAMLVALAVQALSWAIGRRVPKPNSSS